MNLLIGLLVGVASATALLIMWRLAERARPANNQNAKDEDARQEPR